MDAVEEVKNRLSIEDVIGEYVQLKRAGRNFRGLSPFNSEKTPSFMVSPEKQIWHDFSSNKGGNMFSFIMEMEGVDFKGALEILAKKANLDLNQYNQGKQAFSSGIDKDKIYKVLDVATKFYQVQLSRHRQALSYVFEERHLTKETIILWRLGYSPNNGSAIHDYLIKQGFSEQEMIQAGLISKRQGRVSDMFRGRLMIPLQDPQGQVIGFTARQLPNDDYGPKYINTPQTILYDKSRHIFGLHLAKTTIRESKFAVITEGNLDVISSHQAKVNQVVATAGTAITNYHLKGLVRFASDIRLCFDADKAGIAATERAINIASQLNISLNIINLVDGKDPDELINKDPDLWKKSINNYVYAIDWLIGYYQSQFDLSTAQGKRHFTDAILPTINSLSDPVEKDHFLNMIAKKLNIKREALELKSAKSSIALVKPVYKKPKVELIVDPKEAIEIAKVEDHLLCLMLKHRQLRNRLVDLNVDLFNRQQSRDLVSLLKKEPSLSLEQLNKLDLISDYVKIESLQYEELYQGLEYSEIQYEATRLQVRLIEHYVKQQKLNIVKQLVGSDEKTTELLLKQASQLDELLRINLGEKSNAQEK